MNLRLLGLLWTAALLSPASAAEPEPARDAALLAYEVHTEQCAAVAGRDVAVAAESTMLVVEAWARVSDAFDGSGAPHLQYWRGVLAQCLGRGDDAIRDLIDFVVVAHDQPEHAGFVRDAKRRLGQLGIPVASTLRERGVPVGPLAVWEALAQREARLGVGGRFARGQPFVLVALGGGWQRVGPYDYGGLDLDVSVRLVGPLRVVAGGAMAWSGPARGADGEPVEPVERASLTTISVGPELRIPWPVRASLSGRLLLAPNPHGTRGAPLLVGGAVRGGADFPIPGQPVLVGGFVEIGGLERWVAVRLMARLVVAI